MLLFQRFFKRFIKLDFWDIFIFYWENGIYIIFFTLLRMELSHNCIHLFFTWALGLNNCDYFYEWNWLFFWMGKVKNSVVFSGFQGFLRFLRIFKDFWDFFNLWNCFCFWEQKINLCIFSEGENGLLKAVREL